MKPPTQPAQPLAPRRGRYLATALDTGLQIGVDEFEISPVTTGWTLVSRHTPFGNGAGHVARFDLDEAWVPLRLSVESTHGASLEAEFGRRRTVLRVRRGAGGGSADGPAREERMALPVGRCEAFVLLSGGFSLPLLAVRRALSLGSDEAMQFTLLPDGLCELRREPDRAIDHGRPHDGRPHGDHLRLFDMRLMIGTDRDRLRLAVDADGDLVRFHARNRNLLVELDTAGAC